MCIRDSLSTLQNIALSDKSCNLTPLSRLSPITISAQCPTVDLSPLDGKKIQIYVSESISESKARKSAMTGNTVAIMKAAGKFTIFQPNQSGNITESEM